MLWNLSRLSMMEGEPPQGSNLCSYESWEVVSKEEEREEDKRVRDLPFYPHGHLTTRYFRIQNFGSLNLASDQRSEPRLRNLT